MISTTRTVIVISFVLALSLSPISLPIFGAKTVTINSFETGFMKGLPSSGDYDGMAVGDIDGDGYPDLAFGGNDYSSASTTGLYVYRGYGNGTWTKNSSGLPTGDSWGGVALGDADGDGKMELYACNEGWGSSSGSVKGLGAWEFSSGSWSQTGISSPLTSGTTNDVALLNFTKGPGLDLAITSSRSQVGIKAFYGSGTSSITWTSYSNGLTSTGEYTGVAIGDLNNDGLPDLAAGSYSNGGIKVYTQNSTQNGWTDRTSSISSSYTSGNFDGIEIADLDLDGNGDLLFSSSSGGTKLLLGNGGGTGGTSFTWTDISSLLPSSLRSGRFFQLTLDDIDMDGDLDLLAPKYSSGLHIYQGNGSIASGKSFGFTEITGKGLPTTGTYVGAAFIDFDKDGDPDVAGSTWGSGVSLHRSNFTVTDTSNNPPVPKITGGDRSVSLGSAVSISGNTSTDAEDAPSGDPTGTKLTYDWNLTSKPSGSSLSDTAFKPKDSSAVVTLTPDKEGIYTVTLAVKDKDGKWSNKGAEKKVTITCNNLPPVPRSGSNRTVVLGSNVTLLGNSSTDPEDAPMGDPTGTKLKYDWNLTTKPSRSKLNDTVFKPSDGSAFPTFTPDVQGVYTITLSVRDSAGKWSNKGLESKITITCTNSAPIAEAGANLTIMLGGKVALNGSASYDPDGHNITYEWNVTKYPPTSLIRDSSLSPSDKAHNPVLTPDVPGVYRLTLVVRDMFGKWSSNVDTVQIRVEKPNDRPVADAGMDISGFVNTTIVLNGSGSSDPDGSVVAYNWSCTSHPIELLNSTTANPEVRPDEPGMYVFILTVQDDNLTWSDPDEVRATIVEPYQNLPPVSHAGKDATYFVNETVLLNGSGSRDPDGYIVTWEWTCISHVDIVLGDGNSSHPYFVPSDPGTYLLELRVMDNSSDWSLPDTVRITVLEVHINLPPIAVAGDDIRADVNSTVHLDGSGSFDPDGAIDRFIWNCSTYGIELIDPATSEPYFFASIEGNHTFTLTVIDNEGSSSLPDTVVVWVKGPSNPPQPPPPPPPPPPQVNVTPRIGPFLYDDGTPVTGAMIELRWPHMRFEAMTDDHGWADYTNGIPPGNYTLIVISDGSTLLVIDLVIVLPDGNVTYLSGHIPAIARPPSLVPITVGPFLYEDGTPLVKVGVRLYQEETEYTSTTGLDGIAPFPKGVLPGTYRILIGEVDGKMFVMGNITVMRNGTVIYPDGALPRFKVTSVVVYPSIGPFLYSDGTPLNAARIVLISGDERFEALTDQSGIASFSEGIPPRIYDLIVSNDTGTILSIRGIVIRDDGTVIYPNGSLPRIGTPDVASPGDVDDVTNWPLIAFILTIVIVLALVLLFFLLRNRNRNRDDIDDEKEASLCPQCGSEMVFKEDFGTFFCERCGGSEE